MDTGKMEEPPAAGLLGTHNWLQLKVYTLPGERHGTDVPEDLSYEECCQIVDQIAEYAPLILVLSGGEPLWRRDVFDIAERAVRKNIRVALATNGTLVDEAMAHRIKDAGMQRVAISLDGADRQTHDTFRGHAGAFDAAIYGLKCLKHWEFPPRSTPPFRSTTRTSLPGS